MSRTIDMSCMPCCTPTCDCAVCDTPVPSKLYVDDGTSEVLVEVSDLAECLYWSGVSSGSFAGYSPATVQLFCYGAGQFEITIGPDSYGQISVLCDPISGSKNIVSGGDSANYTITVSQ